MSGYDKAELPRPDFDPTAKLVDYIRKAGADGAQLIVFPEYILGHIKVPGPETKRLSAAAAAQRIYVVVGCWETLSDGKFANTALIFDRQGTIAGKYRKTHAAIDHYEGDPPWKRPPSGKDRQWFLENDPEWIMEAGATLPVFQFDFGKVGILTCYDGWFPEPARVLSLKGAELLIWINGRGGTVEDFIVRTTIFQSHMAVVTTNQSYGGGTMIGDWPGRIVERCPDREEAYIVASVDLARIRRVRAASRNFQQRRPELYESLAAPKPLPVGN